MLKRIVERLLGCRFRKGGFTDCAQKNDQVAILEPSSYPDDGAVRIVSDGIASGTKVYLGGREIPNVCSIEIDEILPLGVVSAKIGLGFVELDTCADTESMDVVVGGRKEKRLVQSVDIMVGVDGTESAGLKHPVLFPGECAVYYVDGRPPVIVTELQ